jgi:glycosyltransferase involved in cell wall biosynthesis
MAALYDEADIYLNASEIDNMPLSLMEAFAAGLPVVTTDAGGIPFIAEHGRNALVVSRGDEASLAENAVRLVQEPRLAIELADSARSDCENRYTWEAVRDDWLNAYRSVMERGSGLGSRRG